MVDVAHVGRRATHDGTQPPVAPNSVQAVRGIAEQVELAVEAHAVALGAPHRAAVHLHLGGRPHLADVLPAPAVGVAERAARAVTLLKQHALGEQVLGQPLGQARLEQLLPRLEVAVQVRVLHVCGALVGVRSVPHQVAVVCHAGDGLGHGDGRGRDERDVMALGAVTALVVRVEVRKQEAHGLLGCDGGCAHEGHVQVVAHAQAREVRGGDALVQRVVHAAAADLSRQDGGDALPAVLADEALAVVLRVVERQLGVLSGRAVDERVGLPVNAEALCVHCCHLSFLSMRARWSCLIPSRWSRA